MKIKGKITDTVIGDIDVEIINPEKIEAKGENGGSSEPQNT